MALTVPQNKARGGGPPPPPRKANPSTPPPKSAATAEATAQRINNRREGLIGVSQIGAFLCTVRGKFADVATIDMYAPATCHELALVAEENAVLGKGLDMLAAAGPYTQLLTTGLPFLLQLAANSGKLDWRVGQQLGVMDPAILAEKARTAIELMALEAQAAAAQAQQEAAQQRAAMEKMTRESTDGNTQ
jgi:hypothetical protein